MSGDLGKYFLYCLVRRGGKRKGLNNEQHAFYLLPSSVVRNSITSFIILFKVARGFADVKTGFSDIGLITNSRKWFS